MQPENKKNFLSYQKKKRIDFSLFRPQNLTSSSFATPYIVFQPCILTYLLSKYSYMLYVHIHIVKLIFYTNTSLLFIRLHTVYTLLVRLLCASNSKSSFLANLRSWPTYSGEKKQTQRPLFANKSLSTKLTVKSRVPIIFISSCPSKKRGW